MPDIYEMLTQDHLKVSEMLRKLQDSTEIAEREAMVKALRQELLLHTRFEEDVFYPQVRKAAGLEDQVAEAETEHAEARQLLDELSETDSDQTAWMEVTSELSAAIEHHVQEEESEMFPQARKALDETLAETMANEYRPQKEKALAGV